MTLVDTSVISDVLTGNPAWLSWSVQQLQRCRDAGPLKINEITYAELAVMVDTEGDLQFALAEVGTDVEYTPTSALFLAGKAFARYRAMGGPRTSLLPDFLVGAHAAFAHLPILTRDVRRFRTYFPDVQLISPETT